MKYVGLLVRRKCNAKKYVAFAWGDFIGGIEKFYCGL